MLAVPTRRVPRAATRVRPGSTYIMVWTGGPSSARTRVMPRAMAKYSIQKNAIIRGDIPAWKQRNDKKAIPASAPIPA